MGRRPPSSFHGSPRSKDRTTASAASSRKVCTAPITLDPAVISPTCVVTRQTKPWAGHPKVRAIYLRCENRLVVYILVEELVIFALLLPHGNACCSCAAVAAHRSIPRGSSCIGSRLSSPWWSQNPRESHASGSPQSQQPPACTIGSEVHTREAGRGVIRLCSLSFCGSSAKPTLDTATEKAVFALLSSEGTVPTSVGRDCHTCSSLSA